MRQSDVDDERQPPDPNLAYEGSYYRGLGAAATTERLQALFDGYVGLNYVFLVNAALVVGLQLAGNTLASSLELELVALTLLAYPCFAILIGVLSYRPCNRIAAGKSWEPGLAVLCSFLLGINSSLCCGAIGIIVMQQIAGKEMKRMGVVARSFVGIHKADVAEVQARLRATEPSPVAPTFEP